MSADDFQKMYASVMEGMLKSAVAETRKLFESMVDDLKSEISKIKKENEELKTKCNQFENATSDAKERRDSAVQCVAEQSGSSQTQGQQNKREELQDVLQKAQHYETHGQRNSEMTFVIINENVADVPAVVGMEAFSGLEVAASAGLEGAVVSRICSNEAQTSSQKYEGTSVAQGISSLPNDSKLSCLNGAESPASEPEHRMVLSFVTINNAAAEQPKDGPKGMDIWIDKDLVMFEDQPLVIAQPQSMLEPTEKQKSSMVSLQNQGKGEMALNKQLKVPLQQPAGVTSTDEQLPTALLSNGAEPEHPMLISLATGSDIDQPVYHPNTFVILTQEDGQLITFEEQPMLIALQQSVVEPPEKTQSPSVPQQSPKECEISTNDQLGNTVEQSSGVPTADKTLPEVEQLENETCAVLTNKRTEDEAIPKPDLTGRRKRGRPPKKRRPFKGQQTPDKKILESPVNVDPTNQEVVKEVEASSAVDNVNALSGESPKLPLDQVPEALSSNMSSVQQAPNAHLGEVKNIGVSSLSVSETSLEVEQSLEKGKKSDSQQPVMGMEVDIQVPTTNVSSDVKTTSMPSESHSKPLQPRSRLTSVTLQDAMLLVEAMNTHTIVPQSTVENIIPSTKTPTTPQSQFCQPVSESPAQQSTVDNSVPSTKTPTTPQSQFCQPVSESPAQQSTVDNSVASTKTPTTPQSQFCQPVSESPAQQSTVENSVPSIKTPTTPQSQSSQPVSESPARQSTVENRIHSTKIPTTPQSQSSQPVSESPARLGVPVAPQVSDSKRLPQSPAGTYEALSSLPKTGPSAKDSSVKSILGRRKSSVIPLTHKNPPRIKVITADRMISPSKTGVSKMPPSINQTQLQPHPQRTIHPPPLTVPGPDKRKIGIVPQKIIVVPKMSTSLSSHTFGTPPPKQVSPQSKVINARKPNFLPAPTAAYTPLRSGLRPSGAQKTSVTSQKSLPVVTSQMTATSTNQQLETSQPQKLTVIIPRRQPPRVQMPLVSKKQESTGPVLALPPAHSGTPSQQLKTAAEPQVSSDEAATTSSQTRTSTSDVSELAVQSNSVSAKTNTPPKTVSKVTVSPRLMPASASPPVTPAVQMKNSAVVRLCRLPLLTTPPKGPAEVAGVVSNASIENESVLDDSIPTTQEESSSVVKSTQTSQMHAKEVVPLPEMPTSSTDGHPDLGRSEDVSVRNSQIMTEPNPIQEKPTLAVKITNTPVAVPAEVIPDGKTVTLSSEKCRAEEEESVDGSTEPFLPSALSVPAVVNLTEPLAASAENIKPASNLQKGVTGSEVQDTVLPNNPRLQEKPSTTILRLTAVSSKDASDPHLKMTKTQFLAQLSVSPVVRAPKKVGSKGSADASTNAKLQRKSIMARLRSHVRSRLLGKRAEADQKSQPIIPETNPKSQEILRLEHFSDMETFDEEFVLADIDKSTVAEDVDVLKSASIDSPMSPSSDSIVLNLSADEDDDVDDDAIREKEGSVLPSTSGMGAIIDNECAKNPDGFNPEAAESVSVSPTTDSELDNVGAENPESTVQSHSVSGDANLENVELITISPGTSSSASDSTNPEQRECVSVSPTTDSDICEVGADNPEPTAESCTRSHSMRDGADLQDVGSVTVSAGGSSSASDDDNPEKGECISISPMTDSVDSENPESTVESWTESRSMRDDGSPQNVESVTISPGRSSSASDDSNPGKGECVSDNPKTDTAMDDVDSENPESTAESWTKSRSMRDDASPQNAESITINPGRSSSGSDDGNPGKGECVSDDPKTDTAMDDVDSENPESTAESWTKSRSMRDDASPQNSQSITINPGRSSSASDDGNPGKGECVSDSPKTDTAMDDVDSENPESTAESWTESRPMRDDASPQSAKSVTINPGRSSSASDDGNPGKGECVSISPMTDSVDSENPESTVESYTKSRTMTDDVSPPNVGLITVSSGRSSSAGDGAKKRECVSGRPAPHSAIDDVGAKNPESTENCRKSCSTKRGTNPQNTGSVTVSPEKSSSASDDVNPRKRGRTSASSRKSSSSRDQNTSKKTKSTVVTPQRSTTNGTKPKKTRSIPVSPVKSRTNRDDINSKRAGSPTLSSRKSSSAHDGTRVQMSVSASASSQRCSSNRDDTSLKLTGSASVSPGRRFSARDVTTPKKTASTSVSPRRSAVNKDESVIKRTKSGLNSVKRRRSSRATESSSAKKPRSESASPNKSSHKLAKNGVASKNTGEPPAESPSLSRSGAGPKKNSRVVNAKKVTEAAKTKTTAKTKKSNRANLQSESEESETEDVVNCGAEKNSKSKAVRTTATTPTIRSPLERDGASQSSKKKPLPPIHMDIQGTPQRRVLTSSRLLLKSDLFVSSEENANKKGKAKPRLPVIYPPIGSPLPMPAITPQPFPQVGRVLMKNQCGECGRVLCSQSSLENHIRVHAGSRPFVCKLCGKSFPNLKGLKRHIGVHRNGKIHVCPKCEKGFVYRFGLTKHLQMVHSRIKPFVCQVCSRGFFSRRDVEAHIRIHTGEKPFQCHLCQKKFTRKVELNVHLMWHDGVKRHFCAFCGKGFLDYNNMKRHQYIHTGEKPYACTHCPKRFKQSSHVKKHIASVHDVD